MKSTLARTLILAGLATTALGQKATEEGRITRSVNEPPITVSPQTEAQAIAYLYQAPFERELDTALEFRAMPTGLFSGTEVMQLEAYDGNGLLKAEIIDGDITDHLRILGLPIPEESKQEKDGTFDHAILYDINPTIHTYFSANIDLCLTGTIDMKVQREDITDENGIPNVHTIRERSWYMGSESPDREVLLWYVDDKLVMIEVDSNADGITDGRINVISKRRYSTHTFTAFGERVRTHFDYTSTNSDDPIDGVPLYNMINTVGEE
ncbi:MAG: hypothetical protein H6502_04550 [Candidatus Woesearchaeota archaeon]|nr:MAG: hypothetical protein H6502_04550 [Candidatus Woesearchaeota archaeon]